MATLRHRLPALPVPGFLAIPGYLAVLTLLAGLAPLAAADEVVPEGPPATPDRDAKAALEEYLLDWEIVSRRLDERGLTEQRDLLFSVADLMTPEAQAALKELRDRHGRQDWRRTRLILAALLRYAVPAELDEVVRWVEVRRNPFLLEYLAEALHEVRHPATQAHLRGRALARATPAVKAEIARSLGFAKDSEAVPALLRLLRDDVVRVRVEAIDALARIGDPRAATTMALFLRDKDREVRAAAAEALGALGERRIVPHLLRLLQDPEPRVVECAVLALGRLRGPQAIPDLLRILEENFQRDVRLADSASRALEEIAGIPFGMNPQRWRDWWMAVRDQPWKRVARQETRSDGGTVAQNRYYGFVIRSSRVVFVLDVSRSMGWNDRLKRAKEELIQALEKLPAYTRFNIVTFSDGVEAWARKLEPATPSKVQSAIRFVKKLRPENGTNTWAALMEGLAHEEADTLFLLSDGHPSTGDLVDPELILAELRRRNRFLRMHIHCIALLLGDPPSSFGVVEDLRRAEGFLERLAADHGGQFEVVK